MNEYKLKSLEFSSALNVLYRKRKFIVTSHLIVAVLALTISLLLPKVYKSTATIMVNPPEQMIGLPVNLQDMLPLNFLGSNYVNVDQFLAILNSKSMADSIINKFDLFNVYDVKYKEQVYRELYSNIGFIDNEDGSITIYAKYKKIPTKSAEMVNYIVDTLNKINLELNNERTRNSRQFLEQEYQQIKYSLKKSEDSLATLQRKYGIVEFQEQVKASINLMGEIETKWMLNKIQYDYLSKAYGQDHPIVINMKQQLDSYNKEISNLNNEFNHSTVVLPLHKVPDLGVEYFEAFRDFTVNEALFEFITPIYEKTKLDEINKVPNFVILDNPMIPDYKDSPRRALIIIVSLLLYATISTFIILVKEYYRINKGVIKLIFNEEKEDL